MIRCRVQAQPESCFDDDVVCHKDGETTYAIGDAVYIDSQACDEPFHICIIQVRPLDPLSVGCA
jgi:hypothetical protein